MTFTTYCEHGFVYPDAAHPSAGLESCPMCGFTASDLRSHEPPRNSGEGTAVNGPMPLAGGDESLTLERD
jgi:hypothetical protein